MTKKSRRPLGHYCKICGEYKANEKFSGKGHAAHICKICSRLSAAEKAKAMTINRLLNLPVNRLSASDKEWLENWVKDRHSKVEELAKRYTRCTFLPNATRERSSLLSISWTLKFTRKCLMSTGMNCQTINSSPLTASAVSSS